MLYEVITPIVATQVPLRLIPEILNAIDVIDQLDQTLDLPASQIETLPGPGGSLDHLKSQRQPSTPANSYNFV